MCPSPLLIAHRAGNSPSSARRAEGRADVIEADVHVFRNRVEVRHEKVLRPTARLWERWYLLPAGTTVPVIGEVLAAIDPDTPLLLDLKCATPWAARQIRRAVPGDRRLIVSSRAWWVLGAFADRPDTIRLRSCGRAWHLWLARRLPGLSDRVGLVVHQRLLDEETVAELTRLTPRLFTWAITEPDRARALVQAGVVGLIVDDLDREWPRGA